MIKENIKRLIGRQNDLLKSVNTKDKLYEKLIKTDIDEDPQYVTFKNELYKKTLGRSTNEASGYIKYEHTHCIKMM